MITVDLNFLKSVELKLEGCWSAGSKAVWKAEITSPEKIFGIAFIKGCSRINWCKSEADSINNQEIRLLLDWHDLQSLELAVVLLLGFGSLRSSCAVNTASYRPLPIAPVSFSTGEIVKLFEIEGS